MLKIIVNVFYPPVEDLKQILNNQIYIPINGGSKLNDEWSNSHLLKDNTGDNISHLNIKINEFTVIYWAWKHYDQIGCPDYIGFNHYRRFFNLEDLDDYTKYDMIVSKPIFKSCQLPISTQYAYYHDIRDLQRCIDILNDFDPDFAQRFYSYIITQTENFAPCNMFVCSKSEFFRWCNFIFPVIFRLIDELNLDNRDNYQKRAICFLVERIFGFWCYNMTNVKQIDMIERLEFKNNDFNLRGDFVDRS